VEDAIKETLESAPAIGARMATMRRCHRELAAADGILAAPQPAGLQMAQSSQSAAELSLDELRGDVANLGPARAVYRPRDVPALTPAVAFMIIHLHRERSPDRPGAETPHAGSGEVSAAQR
jgi:hypothetical protein